MGIIEFVLTLMSQIFWSLIGFNFLKLGGLAVPFVVFP